MNAGRLLVADAPQALLVKKNADNLEDAFVAFIRDDRAAAPAGQPAGGDRP